MASKFRLLTSDDSGIAYNLAFLLQCNSHTVLPPPPPQQTPPHYLFASHFDISAVCWLLAKACLHENCAASNKLFILSDKISELLHKINLQSWLWCSCNFGSTYSISHQTSIDSNSSNIFLKKQLLFCPDFKTISTSTTEDMDITPQISFLLNLEEQAQKLLPL